MRQTYGPEEWTEERTRRVLAEIADAKAAVQAARPWDAPDADIAGDLREVFQAAEEEYYRRSSGHRTPIGRMAEDVVESESTPGTYYHLKQNMDGTWSCDCPGYTYRGECKHATRKMEETGWPRPRS